MPAPHRVLRDSELAATRLVDAARAAVALDPCASCDGSRPRDDDDATTELAAPGASPRARDDARDDWTTAYEAFRTQTSARDGARAPIGTQFDEVNARLRAELDLIECRGAAATDALASPTVAEAHARGDGTRARARDDA